METPLTPLEFGRRARKLYGDREAVVDGDLRLTYEQFFDRCDRWSAALQGMGVKKGDLVAYIAPNTHEQLESFYAVPQIGAVLVPINFRLTAEDFVYITSHSGATVLCVHPDYVAAIEGVREQLTGVQHFVVLGSAEGRKGWTEYEAGIARSRPAFDRTEIDEGDLISLNYTSGTTAKPKGVMITHRNAWANVVGTLLHLRIGVDDRYLWTLPMFHANGWTFVWIVTAAGATHICLPKVEPARIFELIRKERVGWLCAAPTVLIALANAPEGVRGEVPPGVRVITAGAPPAQGGTAPAITGRPAGSVMTVTEPACRPWTSSWRSCPGPRSPRPRPCARAAAAGPVARSGPCWCRPGPGSPAPPRSRRSAARSRTKARRPPGSGTALPAAATPVPRPAASS